MAKQQAVGEIQLPLNNLGAVALDFKGEKGIATALGHAPVPALVNPKSGSKLAIAEALTNIVWAPLEDGLKSISLSANWMWPSKNEGEDARLYDAVEAVSDFACELGINIPTGKDSLSMVQKYPNNDKVYAPGTVIITASGAVSNIRQIVEPRLINDENSVLVYIDFSNQKLDLGGSSFAQVINKLGKTVPSVNDATYFANAFNTLQQLIKENKVLAGHDISAGGLITALLEMNFPNEKGGLNINLNAFDETEMIKILFSENPGVIIQVNHDGHKIVSELGKKGIHASIIGSITNERKLNIRLKEAQLSLDIDELRDVWFKTSYLLDSNQTKKDLAKQRFDNYKKKFFHSPSLLILQVS